MINVAIDGPSGAGKSSLARQLAAGEGFLYVDTGALYRAVGLAVMRRGGNTKAAADVEAALPETVVDLKYVNGEQRVFLNGGDVSDEIRKEEVGMAASDVSALPAVRAFLLEAQRRLARENNVIMDGRDIGTVVLPNADVKIFLTASAGVRAARRVKQLEEKGETPDYGTVLRDVQARDHQDTHRDIAPLKQADDAVLVDTTELDFAQSLAALKALVDKAKNAGLPGEAGP